MWERRLRDGVGGQKFCLGHGKFEWPGSHLSGEIQQTSGYKSLGFRREVWVEGIILEVTACSLI